MTRPKQSHPKHPRPQSRLTRFMNALLLRDARIRQMIDRELRRERPSALRLMRMKRLALSLRQRLDRVISESAVLSRPRLVPVLVRVH